eukprot:SAG11_NODE_338_length_10535_cov_8.199885_11_plen_442_part_00
MEGCVLGGNQGGGRDGQWQVVSKEVTWLPGTTTAAAAAAAAEKAGSGKHRVKAQSKDRRGAGATEPPDVVYVEGDLPLCIMVPTAGLKGGRYGSSDSRALWEGTGNAAAPRRITLLAKPCGDGSFAEGAPLTDADGKVRAHALGAPIATQDGRLELQYCLDPSTAAGADFKLHDWVHLADSRWRKRELDDEDRSVFFKAASDAALLPAEDSDAGADGGGNADGVHVAQDAEESRSVLDMVSMLRERLWETTGGTPHIVLCYLDPAKLDVDQPLERTVVGMDDEGLRQRAVQGWLNYHTFIEVAKYRMTGGAKIKRSGCSLLLELRKLKSATEGLELGYGLMPYELKSVLPGNSRKPPPVDDATISRAFALFDKDGSGSIDERELAGVAKQIGLPMTADDVAAAMAAMDDDGSGEVDKAEFKAWFRSLAEPKDGAKCADRPK